MVGRRRGSVKWGAALAVLVLVGCASPGVSKLQVYVTRDKKVVLDRVSVPAGETILKVENDDGEKHTVVLARLTDDRLAATELPTVGGQVVTGKASKQRFTGDGYEVVAKSDDLKAYFNGPNRVTTLFHVHLDPGRYLVFSNQPGDYAAGILTELTVRS